MRNWLSTLSARMLYIEPGSHGENGYCESFNGKLHDECLNGEIFYSLREATAVIEQWRNQYNTIRPLISELSAASATDIHSSITSTGSQLLDATISNPLVQNIRQVTIEAFVSCESCAFCMCTAKKFRRKRRYGAIRYTSAVCVRLPL
jgi:Integrase core domain